MTDVEEVLLELELVLEDLRQLRPKEALLNQYIILLERLVDIMAMTLRGTISVDCSEHLSAIFDGAGT